jgi:hypothetical protein
LTTRGRKEKSKRKKKKKEGEREKKAFDQDPPSTQGDSTSRRPLFFMETQHLGNKSGNEKRLPKKKRRKKQEPRAFDTGLSSSGVSAIA